MACHLRVALGLAFFAFRHKLPLSLRSIFYPLVGDRIYGPFGHLVDVFAVLGTMFGVATSLGLGVMQVNAGLDFLFDIGQSQTAQLLLIAAITGAATLSVVSSWTPYEFTAERVRPPELNEGSATAPLRYRFHPKIPVLDGPDEGERSVCYSLYRGLQIEQLPQTATERQNADPAGIMGLEAAEAEHPDTPQEQAGAASEWRQADAAD